MNREKAIADLDEAFKDSMGTMFEKLVVMLIDGDAEARYKFHIAMATRDEAYAIALREIEIIFPD